MTLSAFQAKRIPLGEGSNPLLSGGERIGKALVVKGPS